MKLVTFGIDDQRNLIIQFLVFVQMELVPVSITDDNEQAQSHTYLKVKKPYTVLNSDTYSTLRTQELDTCKRIGSEFYCEELFVVKHKTKYNCESAIYFDLLIRLLSLSIFIIIRTGTAKKSKKLKNYDKLSLASILKPLHQVLREMLGNPKDKDPKNNQTGIIYQ